MTKISLFIWLFLSFLGVLPVTAQSTLLSYELVETYDISELEAAWKKIHIPQAISPIRYPVDVYKVVYESRWHDGSPVKASGFYFVPNRIDQAAPLLVFHHGTQTKRERKVKLGGLNAICIAFATDGYQVAMPDYLGLGEGERFHLYQHAQTEATASLDMMLATSELNDEKGMERNDQLFISGYSQGGHATLALHKAIQEEYSDQFQVTASSPMSGAYDMSGVQSEVMFRPYSHPGYLPYLFKGIQEVYGVLDHDFQDAFKAPYDSVVANMFDGVHSLRSINKHLPSIPADMVKETYIEKFKSDPDFAFVRALKENDVYDWKPESPVQLCYCNADEQVNYKNSIVAYQHMKDYGSKHVTLRNAGKRFGHNKCALFACIYTKMYFDSFVKGSKKGRKGPLANRVFIGTLKWFVKR